MSSKRARTAEALPSIGPWIGSPGSSPRRLPGPGWRARHGWAARRLLAAALAPAALAVAMAAAPAALAGESEPPAGPIDDGSCETRPTSYPADGEPVPEDAGCTLILAADLAVIGEVWSWADADSIQWYNYASSSLPPPVSGEVIMCGSTDEEAAGVVYTCTAESTYLLFTVSGVFVEWPTAPPDALHFCERVAFGTGPSAVVGGACSSVLYDPVGNDPLGGVPPTQTASPSPSNPSEPPTQPPPPEDSPPPTTAPSDGAVPGNDPAGGTSEPTQEQTSGGGVAPSESGPADPAGGSPSAQPGATSPDDREATALPLPPDESGRPAATPVQGTSIATVGGSRFPMGFVLVLAVALGLAGYVTLAGPGLVAARRQHR